MSLAGVVLAGGASRRMGRDKALLAVDGTPMALRVAAALAAAGCDPVWCQGGDAAALGALGLRVEPDPAPGAGPLPAIRAALAHGPAIVAACDLAWLDAATVALVRDAPACDVAVATTGQGAHLLARWSAAAAEPLARLLGEGVVAYRAALARLGALAVAVPEPAVRNANRPTDLP